MALENEKAASIETASEKTGFSPDRAGFRMIRSGFPE